MKMVDQGGFEPSTPGLQPGVLPSGDLRRLEATQSPYRPFAGAGGGMAPVAVRHDDSEGVAPSGAGRGPAQESSLPPVINSRKSHIFLSTLRAVAAMQHPAGRAAVSHHRQSRKTHQILTTARRG